MRCWAFIGRWRKSGRPARRPTATIYGASRTSSIGSGSTICRTRSSVIAPTPAPASAIGCAKKYGTLDALNASWYRTFTAWNLVDPPRFGTILSYADFLDWKAFISDKLAEDLRAKEEAVHEADQTRLTTSHSDIPSVLASPLDDYGMPDDWKMSAQVDYYGASIYPKHASAQLGGWPPAFRAFAFDGEYSASRRR